MDFQKAGLWQYWFEQHPAQAWRANSPTASPHPDQAHHSVAPKMTILIPLKTAHY
jgi:hypothetical protein